MLDVEITKYSLNKMTPEEIKENIEKETKEDVKEYKKEDPKISYEKIYAKVMTIERDAIAKLADENKGKYEVIQRAKIDKYSYDLICQSNNIAIIYDIKYWPYMLGKERFDDACRNFIKNVEIYKYSTNKEVRKVLYVVSNENTIKSMNKNQFVDIARDKYDIYIEFCSEKEIENYFKCKNNKHIYVANK